MPPPVTLTSSRNMVTWFGQQEPKSCYLARQLDLQDHEITWECSLDLQHSLPWMYSRDTREYLPCEISIIAQYIPLSKKFFAASYVIKDVTCSQEDIEGSWVPSQNSHSFTVSLQGHNGLGHWTRQAPVWNLPYLQTKTHSRCLFAKAFIVIYDGYIQVHWYIQFYAINLA